MLGPLAHNEYADNQASAIWLIVNPCVNSGRQTRAGASLQCDHRRRMSLESSVDLLHHVLDYFFLGVCLMALLPRLLILVHSVAAGT